MTKRYLDNRFFYRSHILSLLILLCLSVFNITAQIAVSDNLIVDSLRKELLKSPPDSVKFNIFMKLSNELQRKKPYEALDYSNKALRLAKDDYERARAFTSIGFTYKITSDYPAALTSYFQALRLYESIGEEKGRARVLINMANCYLSLKRDALAEKYINEALKIQERSGNYNDMGVTYTNLGLISTQQGDLNKAITYYEKAAEIAQIIKYQEVVPINNLGDIYIRLKDYQKAEYYYKKALEVSQTEYEITGTYISLGELYMKQQRFDEAARYLFKAKRLSDSYSIGLVNIDVFHAIALMYEKQNDFKNANAYYKQYYALKDSSLNETVTEQINELQAKYEFDKKDQELQLANKSRELLEAEINNKEKILILLSAVTLLAFILIAIVFFFFRQKRKSADLLKNKNEKIESLMTEMYHRVKNNFQVLSDIFTLQSTGNEQTGNTSAMQDSKARIDALLLLHQKLNPSNPLNEIDFVHYIDELIENIVFQFDYSPEIIIKNYDVQEKHVDIDLLLPVGLIVNEILTNAFKHAIPKVKKPEVCISIHEINGMMNINIKDNGPAREDSIKEPKHSFGIRLLQTFAKQIQADLSYTIQNGLEWKLIFKTHAN